MVEMAFAERITAWQLVHGRHDLPWQVSDPYRVWLSEIMLQQTQVSAVIPYFQRFLLRFPDVASLAEAPTEDVMAHWSGLGYYTRARNLHRCAKLVVVQYGGRFPADPALLAELPGIGRSTAAAIAAFAYGARAAILDGNVKRVFARVFGVEGYPGDKPVEMQLWQRAVALLPERGVESYTQGLMDLGATVCTRSKPECERCPLSARCVALQTCRVEALPTRKRKMTIPERETAMLIVMDGDHVLLEQRPPSGIWGGLLSLPEIAAQSDQALLAREVTGAIAPFGEVAGFEGLPPFSHTFTHFRLHVAPYRVRLSRRLDLAGQLEYVWYQSQKIADAPLPAPVKKLLLQINQQVK